MIFNRRHDRSLWMMTLGNKKELIIDFINGLPEEFCEEIKRNLKKCNNSSLENRGRKLDGIYISAGDMVYRYLIDVNTGALSISESILCDGEEYNKMWMTIYPFRMEYYKSIQSLNACLLGNISYNFMEDYVDDKLQVVNLDNVEFNLVKLPFNRCAVCSSMMESRFNKNEETTTVEKDNYDLVNMSIIPNTYQNYMLGKKYVYSRK